jgi:hypothetical protein
VILGTGGVDLHPVLLRLASNGTVLAMTEIVTPDVAVGFVQAVTVDAVGRTFIAGSGGPAGASDPAFLLLAFDPNDVLLWTRSLTGPGGSFSGGAAAIDVALDAFGRVVVAGWRRQGAEGAALLLGTWSTAGIEQWLRVVTDVAGGPSPNVQNVPSRLLCTPRGETVVAGGWGFAVADLGNVYAMGFDADGATRFTYLGFAPANDGWDLCADAALVPGDGFVVAGRVQTQAGNLGFDAFVSHFTRTAVAICTGDGSSGPCPCANETPPVQRAGCAHSAGIGGRLVDLGSTSLSADGFVLLGSAMPNAPVVYVQASAVAASVPFGDGLSCAGGTRILLGTKLNAAGASRFPDSGDPPVSVAGAVTGPGTLVYEAWYRNAAAFCTPATANVTNGLVATWLP